MGHSFSCLASMTALKQIPNCRPKDRYWLRAQPVDATPFVLTGSGLKPKAFLWRDLSLIRGCASTSEKGREQHRARLVLI